MAKNPSVVRSVLSCTFTPSSVMLMVPRGSPLMVAWRLPPGVDTPGRKLTKSMALRLVRGSFVIWVVFNVVETVEDCVWMISDVDETVTCWLRPPSSSDTFTLAGAPAVRTTLLATKVLKPSSLTVTL